MTTPPYYHWEPFAPGKRRRALVGAVAWPLFVLACLVIPGSEAGSFIVCPWRMLTGYSCPGCGMTRSCHAAVQGDWLGSIDYHPFGLALIVLFGVWSGGQLWFWSKGARVVWSKRAKRHWRVVWASLLFAVVLFWGVRFVSEWCGILTPI